MLISIHLGPLPWPRKPYSPVSVWHPDTKDYCINTPGGPTATALHFVPSLFLSWSLVRVFLGTTIVALAKQVGCVAPGTRGDKCHMGMRGPPSRPVLEYMGLSLQCSHTHVANLGSLFSLHGPVQSIASSDLNLDGQKNPKTLLWNTYMLTGLRN